MKTKPKKRMVLKTALTSTILFYLISFGPFVALAADFRKGSLNGSMTLRR